LKYTENFIEDKLGQIQNKTTLKLESFDFSLFNIFEELSNKTEKPSEQSAD
jgi:hypothetical protein